MNVGVKIGQKQKAKNNFSKEGLKSAIKFE